MPCSGPPREDKIGSRLSWSRLEDPRDGGAWWAAVCGVAESDTTEVTQQQEQPWYLELGAGKEKLPAPVTLCRAWAYLWQEPCSQ